MTLCGKLLKKNRRAQVDRRPDRRDNWKHDSRDARQLVGKWYANGSGITPRKYSPRVADYRREMSAAELLGLTLQRTVMFVPWTGKINSAAMLSAIESSGKMAVSGRDNRLADWLDVKT
jgi:predicted nucleotidyltransferase